MSQIKSIALAALLGIGVAGLSGHVSAASAESANTAGAKVYAQNDGVGGELSVRPRLQELYREPLLPHARMEPTAIAARRTAAKLAERKEK